MSKEIQISEVRPVSFSGKEKELSVGQQLLLELLKQRIIECSPITISDIVDVYFKTVSKDGDTVRVRGNLSYTSFYCHKVDKNNQTARSRAVQWFKQNLGACIIKGKLLVVPIIDMDTKIQPKLNSDPNVQECDATKMP